MNTTKQRKIGDAAEAAALCLLESHGLHLLERNYTCFHGEIDLIMQDKEDTVFVEVRYRTKSDYGDGLESVDRHKIRKLTRAAKHYLQAMGLLYRVNSRFDIIAIHPDNGISDLEWIVNAFTVDKDL
jgi:putative endonuclease